MIWVLAVDTSSPGGAVALLRDDVVVAERRGSANESHAERLPRAIQEVVADAGLTASAVDLFAVATGPGAFTGLRVGLATVQGLAVALDRPTTGISSLAATAWRHFADDAAASCGVWLDGARGDVFAAAFGRAVDETGWPLAEIAAPTVATPAVTLERWRGLVPDEAPLLMGPGQSGGEVAAAAGRAVVVADAPLAVPVGRIGRLLHLAGRSGPPHALAPLYVRRPDAEIERERRLGLETPAR